MRILFTGASSFSGMWFVKTLSDAGHDIVAPMRASENAYEGLKKERILQITECADIRYSTSFGSDEFKQILDNQKFDLFCHHAADVTNYKSPDFDPVYALKNNTGPITSIITKLKNNGCDQILLTGSVFEPGEGAGSDGLRAVSPYGLSKGLTSEMYKYYCEIHKMRLGKFVIPNPFGPFEEFRFTSFLMKNWFDEKNVNVSQPAYVRDNIHVSLLAKAYLHFAENLSQNYQKINPSGYPESQGAFTARFANEMKKRLNLSCEFNLSLQKEFLEPKVRLNIDLLDNELLQWDENKAWDQLAAHYENIFSKQLA